MQSDEFSSVSPQKSTKMKGLAILALCLTAVLATPFEAEPTVQQYLPFNQVPKPDSRIINGSPAADGQFPWQVALYLNTGTGTAFCGGSLIGTDWVLTAAHCIDGIISFQALLGSINVDTPQLTVNSASATMHPNYNRNTLANDIGVIRLASSVPLGGNIQTINLASATLGGNVDVTVSGWGRTSDSSSAISKTLNYVQLSTITNNECSQTYGTLHASIVCCQGATIESTCNGDSGGPLVTSPASNPVQVGTVSFGSSAGCALGYPVGFQRVATHRTWITEVTGI